MDANHTSAWWKERIYKEAQAAPRPHSACPVLAPAREPAHEGGPRQELQRPPSRQGRPEGARPGGLEGAAFPVWPAATFEISIPLGSARGAARQQTPQPTFGKRSAQHVKPVGLPGLPRPATVPAEVRGRRPSPSVRRDLDPKGPVHWGRSLRR
mmetsp:Transcript_66583/g.214570  ORF Transcript_66583/g.214570 Transcript_66583/m.214570 type:complete len:154 (+) Transcript_66583:63-524(+)